MSPASVGWMASGRLSWAVFIATAAHGLLILGVTFTVPERTGSSNVPVLEVALLESPASDSREPQDARYIAQTSQAGSGNTTEHERPEFYEHPPAATAATAPVAPAAARHVSAWRGALATAILPPETVQMLAPTEPRPEGGVTRVSASDPREFFVSVNARESVFAEYLITWKARMERLGTLNFPPAARRSHGPNPVLEVALAADGALKAIRITRSSGHGALDQAAIDLVRLGSPFDPFPTAARPHYDTLRFAYEWRFIDGRAAIY